MIDSDFKNSRQNGAGNFYRCHVSQLLSAWNALEAQRKLVVALAIIATLIAFTSVIKMASSPGLSLLYSGLDSATSNEIVSSLEQKSIVFEVRGDAIYVDSSARDRARLTLAGEGLPSGGPEGYELLDTLSGFGTTSQMFDAAYSRAVEGELAKTILASAQIKVARVHIANAHQQPFGRKIVPTASVTVTGKNGAVSIGQAEAIRYLVAAAVSGLIPENVSIIDSAYGILLQPGDNFQNAGGNGDLDGRAEELRANIERLLSARVGQGNVLVEVMVEARAHSETITERTLDPEGSVPISSDSESNSDTTTGGAAGAVTVASNLPDTGDSGGEGGNSSSRSQTRERVNYDISETVRERINPAGEIARLSVAVLVNGEITNGPNGPTFTERTPEEIAAFQALVRSTVGFNAERGDIVTIESMEFQLPAELGSVATAGFLSTYVFDVPMMLQMGILALVTLGLGMFVIKPILSNSTPPSLQLSNDSAAESFNPESAGFVALSPSNEVGTPRQISIDPIEILKETIAQRSEESGHLLRNWIEVDGAKLDEPVA